MDTTSISTTVRLRLPRQLLAVIEEWAAAHDQPRSKAIQQLALRGLVSNASWQQQPPKLAA